MALRELPPSAVHVSRRNELTYEEACDEMNENWVFDFEQADVAIRDVLAGRVEVGRFAKSSQLDFMVNLIFTFFENVSGHASGLFIDPLKEITGAFGALEVQSIRVVD